MEFIIQTIEAQSPFIQGLIAAAVFGLASWIFRFIKSKIVKSGGQFLSFYERQEVVKHWLHKNYVNSRNIDMANHGISFVALQAFRYCLLAMLLIILFFGVGSVLNGDWLFVAASWFSFNLFLEAYSWVRDSSDPKRLENVSKEVQEDFYTSLSPNQPESTANEQLNSDAEKDSAPVS